MVPVYNEESLLASILPEILRDVATFDGGAEVIFVDNGSDDRTAELLGIAAGDGSGNIRACRLGRPDYGAALQKGFMEAQGSLRATMDLDAWNPRFIRQASSRLGDGTHVVVGCKDPAQDRRPFPRRWTTGLHRFILGRLLPQLRGLDVHGPLLLDWDRCAGIVAECHSGADAFKTELLLHLVRSGMTIASEPISIAELRPARTSLPVRIVRYLPMLWRLARNS